MTARKLDPTFPHKSHKSRGFNKRTCLCEAQNWRCCYCGIRFSDDAESDAYGSVEHVVPIVAGGLTNWENEVMACRLCNEGRGAMYARRYLQQVVWRGREKAYRWGVHRRRKRAAAKQAHQDRKTPGALAARLGEVLLGSSGQ